MNLLQSLLYGFISGITEFLPISSPAHQRVMRQLFGVGDVPLLNIIVCFAVLASLITVCYPALSRIHREQRKIRSRRYRPVAAAGKSNLELRLLRSTAIPMCIGMAVLMFIFGSAFSLPTICFLLVINGLVLFLTEHVRHGNKDVYMMSRLDSIFIGIFGAFSVLPGISGIGMRTAAAELVGADRQNAFHWSLLLGIPSLAVLAAAYILQVFALGFESLTGLSILYYLFAAIGAYIGAYLSIQLMRLLIVRSGTHGFAYYSWGVALFTFILYLI